MLEEILPNLYKIEIPLPGNPLKTLNSCVVKASDRNLIVDTGWNRKECMSAMQAGLRKLAVDLGKTDFFITHSHTDHLGLVSSLAKDGSTIYFNQPDADFIKSVDRWKDYIDFAGANGFPKNEFQAALHSHPGYTYRTTGDIAFTILKESDTISIGEYLFECVETPGHSRGHMCLTNQIRKFLSLGTIF